MRPRRIREFHRVDRSRRGTERHKSIRTLQPHLPCADSAQRTTTQNDPSPIDGIVTANRFDRFIDIRFALKAICIFPESPHRMDFDVVGARTGLRLIGGCTVSLRFRWPGHHDCRAGRHPVGSVDADRTWRGRQVRRAASNHRRRKRIHG